MLWMMPCERLGWWHCSSKKKSFGEYDIPSLNEAITTIVVSLDGAYVLMRDDDYREAMVGNISLYDVTGKRLHTVYIGEAPEYGKGTFFSALGTRNCYGQKTLSRRPLLRIDAMLATIIRLAQLGLTPSFYMTLAMFVCLHNLSPLKIVRMPEVGLLLYVARLDAYNGRVLYPEVSQHSPHPNENGFASMSQGSMLVR
jgi:hypothetical protein